MKRSSQIQIRALSYLLLRSSYLRDHWANIFGHLLALLLLGLVLGWSGSAFPVEVVRAEPNEKCEEIEVFGRCEEIIIARDKELRVYKDFTLLGLIEAPHLGVWESVPEDPLIGSFRGVVSIVKLGCPRKSNDLSRIETLYQTNMSEKGLTSKKKALKGKRPSKFLPVMLCGTDTYRGTLGFVSWNNFVDSRREDYVSGGPLPPSTPGNPIIPREREP